MSFKISVLVTAAGLESPQHPTFPITVVIEVAVAVDVAVEVLTYMS